MTTTQRKYVPCIYQDVLGVSGFLEEPQLCFVLLQIMETVLSWMVL